MLDLQNVQFPQHWILHKDDVISLIKDILETNLNDREQVIIRMRYGFDDGIPKTLEEVSSIIGRTRERVRQIQHQALKKLKLNIADADLGAMVSFAYASNN